MSTQISDERLEDLLRSASPYPPDSTASPSLRQQRIMDDILHGRPVPGRTKAIHRRNRLVAATVAVASVAIIVAGVVSVLTLQPGRDVVAATPATPTPSSSPSSVQANFISGTGPTVFPGADFPLPGDARSVVIDFECVGGGPFSVELGDSMMLGQAPLSGTCDGATQLAWPVTERTGPTLHVVVNEGVDWVATARFSTEEFAFDAAITADCQGFSGVWSALQNADTGYNDYNAFDAAEWNSRVDEALDDLEMLVASSQSRLGDTFAQFRNIVTDPAPTVGAVMTAAAREPIVSISQACDANQTPLILQGEFGG